MTVVLSASPGKDMHPREDSAAFTVMPASATTTARLMVLVSAVPLELPPDPSSKTMSARSFNRHVPSGS